MSREPGKGSDCLGALWSHGASGQRVLVEVLVLASAALTLAGCTAVPLARMRPIVVTPQTNCGGADARLMAGESSDFHYVVPESEPKDKDRVKVSVVNSFEQYRARVRTIVGERVPSDLKDHKVTNALTDFLTSVSAEAQLEAQASSGRFDANALAKERKSIERLNAPVKLTHREMKDFSEKLFDQSLKVSSASLTGLPASKSAVRSRTNQQAASRPVLDKALVAYLSAYYKGEFIDRLGIVATKPNISTTIPDSEIAAAETVLLEFLMDTIDPTPVMGSDPHDSVSKSTIFYPGNSTNQPTAYTTQLATYVQIPNPDSPTDPTVCGITTKNAWVLKDLANGAGDQAAAVGGLIANTPGGLSLGLGVIGKISIGDNQTLSTLVKTAASRVASRAALASSYWSLRNVRFNVQEP